MTKNEYLKKLQSNLKNISSEEAYDIVEYYREYFEDAGTENEDKVIEELGEPEKLALQLSASQAIKNLEGDGQGTVKVKKPLTSLWIIIMTVCAAPLWFPLAIAVAIVIFAAVIVVFSILFAMGISSLTLVLSGILMVVMGIFTLFTSIPTALLVIGCALISVGFGILFLIAIYTIIGLCKKCIIWCAKRRIEPERGMEYESK